MSTARYPCFEAAWGTGKTLASLLKGLILSQAYKGNLGLIVRRVFVDLRDSSIKDFERYTGMTVPLSTKEVDLPNGSKIMFRHGDDLAGLQNINLGWFYIEQAEEFESSDQFNMLRGRLRRELQHDPNFAGSDSFPTLMEHLKTKELRQGMVVANKCGHNWIWHDWTRKPQSSDFELHEATTYDNKNNLPVDFIKDIDSMQYGTETAKRKWRIYVMNSSDELDLEGAYYSKLIQEARASGRIGRYDWDPALPVHTWWDLGVADKMCIVFVQFKDCPIIIDYFEGEGEGIGYYAKILKDKPYVYGEHFAPHDVKNRSIQTGVSLLKFAEGLGLNFKTVQDHKVMDRIEAVRTILPICRINEKLDYLLDILEHYRKEKNDSLSTEERIVYRESPLHDWSSHGCDCVGYMAVTYRFGTIAGKYIGDNRASASYYNAPQVVRVDKRFGDDLFRRGRFYSQRQRVGT